MNKRSLFYCFIGFPIIFISLLTFTLTNVPTNFFSLMNGVDHGLSTISFIPKVTAKSDADSIVFDSIIDEIHSTNLEQTVRDLSSFHTRHTESEFIDDVTYWLTDKLQNICGTDVYIQNFTYTPEKTNDYNDDNGVKSNNNSQRPISYNLTLTLVVRSGLMR
jgi:hypothetical protein